MFTAKSFLFLALLAISAQVAVAAPPACLLAAVNTEPIPGDLNTVCGADASKVQSQIQSLCGDNTSAALDAFKSVCAAAGKTVSTASASGTTTLMSASSSTTMISQTIETSSGSASITSGYASSPTASAPYGAGNDTIVYTSTFFDSSCSCVLTTAISTNTAIASTGFATASFGSGSGSASGATGSPIAPSTRTAPSSTSSGTSPVFASAASQVRASSYAAIVMGAVGLLMAV